MCLVVENVLLYTFRCNISKDVLIQFFNTPKLGCQVHPGHYHKHSYSPLDDGFSVLSPLQMAMTL